MGTDSNSSHRFFPCSAASRYVVGVVGFATPAKVVRWHFSRAVGIQISLASLIEWTELLFEHKQRTMQVAAVFCKTLGSVLTARPPPPGPLGDPQA